MTSKDQSGDGGLGGRSEARARPQNPAPEILNPIPQPLSLQPQLPNPKRNRKPQTPNKQIKMENQIANDTEQMTNHTRQMMMNN